MGKDDRLADDLRLPGWPGKLPEDKWIVWKFAFPVPPQFQAASIEGRGGVRLPRAAV